MSAERRVLELARAWWRKAQEDLQAARRPVNGCLSMALQARRCGLKGFVVPADNAREAAVVSGAEVIPVNHLGGGRRLPLTGARPQAAIVAQGLQAEPPWDSVSDP